MRAKTAVVAREGIRELIRELDTEIIIPVKQDESKSSYFSYISEDEVMLDFSKSAEEISAHIRALHPLTKCYFQYNNHFFIPNSYKLEIIDSKEFVEYPCGTIVDKCHKDRSITVVCGDNRLLKMQGVRLFGALKFLTALYIKFRVKRFSFER